MICTRFRTDKAVRPTPASAPIAFVDLETRSTVNLQAAGPARYAAEPTTDVWCAAWAIGDGPIRVWRPGEAMPEPLADHVHAGGVVCAHNAGFERAIWRYILGPRHGWPGIRLEQWDCTAARAAAMALPRKLEDAARALGLPVEKDMAGHRLMLQMARPRAVNGALIWWDDDERRARLEAYCAQDLVVERELHHRLPPLNPTERAVFLLDARVNDRGVALDLELVEAAGRVAAQTLRALNAELADLTDGAVSSAAQIAALTRWLNAQGVPGTVESLDRHAVERLLAQGLPAAARRALEIRAEASRTSTAKLRAFQARAGSDGRARDNLLYHGASTGRWAGRGVQLQNLPRRVVVRDPDAAVAALMKNESLATIGQPLAVISELLRCCLVAAPGCELVGGDFNAVEARVLAWLAGERELLRLFRTGGDPYRAIAARIYRRPAESFAKDSHERQVGKVTILGAGYQMGAARFRDGLAKAGIEIDEATAERVIATYRAAHPRIVELWHGLERAARQAISRPGLIVPAASGRLKFRVYRDRLWLRLPCGRLLAYAEPRLDERESSLPAITYQGIDTYTRKWGRQGTFGGRLTENVVSAIARDLLAAAMLRLEAAGYRIVLTVHDEVLTEVPAGFGSVAELEQIICAVPDWAAGCPLAAEGWRGPRYSKG